MSALPPMRPIWQSRNELSNVRHNRSLSSSLQSEQIQNRNYQNSANSSARNKREGRYLRHQQEQSYQCREKEEWKQEYEEEHEEEQEIERIRVVLRIRPPLPRELKYYNTTHGGPFVSLVSVVNKTTIALREHVTMPHGEQVLCSQQRFSFDNVFSANSSQDDVYNECAREAVHSVLHGYNATLLAYGQTGTGKTYTMEGFPQHDTRGIIPHAVEDVFDYIAQHKRRKYRRKSTQSFQQNQTWHHPLEEEEQEKQYTITASYLQIYNEVISDLLVLPSHESSSSSSSIRRHNMQHATSSLGLAANSSMNSISNYLTGKPNAKEYNTPRLSIRESPEHGIYVDGLSEWEVKSPEDVYTLLERGTALRTTASTRMSELSSRSHAIFTLIVSKKETVYDNNDNRNRQNNTSLEYREHMGKLNIVDLAGSEKIKQSGSSGIRLEEAKCINKSLHALGNVIAALAKRSTKTNTRRHLSTDISRNKSDTLKVKVNSRSGAHVKSTSQESSFLEPTSLTHSLSRYSSSSSELNMFEEEEEELNDEGEEDDERYLTSFSSFISSSAPSTLGQRKTPHSSKHKGNHIKMHTSLPHIPFRNSVLTNLLRDSLGGNCRTTLIACISPSLDSYTETLMTLQFASRAKHIHTYSQVNITSLHNNDNMNDANLGSINKAALDELIRTRTHELVASYEDKINALQCELQRVRAIQGSEHKEELINNYISNNNWSELSKPENQEEALYEEMHKRELLEQRVHELEHTLEFSLSKENQELKDKIKSVNNSSSHFKSNDEHYSAKEYSRLIEELEVERASLIEHSTHIDTYKNLLLKQREMMVRLNQRLTERDEVILHLQDEVEAYDIHVQELERQLMSCKNVIEVKTTKDESNNQIIESNLENTNNNVKNKDAVIDGININASSSTTVKSCCHSWEQIQNNANQIVKHEYNSNLHYLHSALQLTQCRENEAQSIISILCDVIAKINETLCDISSNMISESGTKKDLAFMKTFTQDVMTKIEKTQNTSEETFAQLQCKLVQERTARIRAMRMCNELQSQMQILAQEHKSNLFNSPLLEQLHSCWNEIEREMIIDVNNENHNNYNSISLSSTWNKTSKNELASLLSPSDIHVEQKNKQEIKITKEINNNSNDSKKAVDALTELVKSQEATIAQLQNKLYFAVAKATDGKIITTTNNAESVANTNKVSMHSEKRNQEEHEVQQEKPLIHHTMKLINDSLTMEINDLKVKLSQHVKDRHALQMIMEQRVKTKIDNICEMLESLEMALVDQNNPNNIFSSNIGGDNEVDKTSVNKNIKINNEVNKTVYDKLYKVKSQARSLHKLVSAAITAMNDLSAIE